MDGILNSDELAEVSAAAGGSKPVPQSQINNVQLYYFEGRNTAVVATSIRRARVAMKRGGSKLVSTRKPTDSEKKQLLKGVWLRNRKDGKTPEKSAHGKGRGFGPPR